MRSLFAFKTILATALLGLAVAGPLPAQQVEPGAILGQVTHEDGTPLPNARVVAVSVQTGRQFGALTTTEGAYRITDLPPGSYRVEVRLIGYNTARQDRVVVVSGESTDTDFFMGTAAIAMDALEVFATRAVERETPVAFSDVDKEQIEQQMASQDMPLIMNVTPSVYATESGGAKGDARINVRGFDQRNVAVMINGVPVNDMENGWVYWSNWDGIGDATSSVQLQRGLSAVNLATPSIGGTLNIITDATALTPGGGLKQEFGSEGYIKTTANLATGMIGDFAFMAQGVYQDGQGLPKGAWNTGWSYYLGASWAISGKNRLDLYALGAPQRHGQRLYKQNVAAFDTTFALGLDSYDPNALRQNGGDWWESNNGHRFNQNWNTVSESYTGKQAAGSNIFDRKIDDRLNERENFFHKPQVNLNWHSQFTPTLNLSTVAYYSGGAGGGTGTLGDFEWNYDLQPTRVADWDGNVRINSGTLDDSGNPKPAGRSDGILRNSRNNQWTIGLISKLKKQFDSPLTMELGVDWRTAEIDHFREVRDLLGGNYYLDDSNEFEGEQQRQLGEKVAYDFTNTVDWLGGFLQGEWSTPKYTVFGMAGVSTIKYGYTNHFFDDGDGNEVTSNPDNIVGGQFKAGGLYNLTDKWGLFVNAGYISKVPIFDAVIDDYAGATNPDPKNEKFISFEAGANYNSVDRSVVVNLNAYFTQWNDRTITRGFVDETGNEGLVSLLGLDARHMGVEAEAQWRLSNIVSLNAAASFADWEYTDDVAGTWRPDEGEPAIPFDFYTNGLKVGDAPQMQFMYGVTVFPTQGVFLQLLGRTYAKHYSAFDPLGRDDPDDRTQSWKAPGYTTFDLHTQWAFPESFRLGNRTQIFVHVLNVFNSTYILDSVDNSAFNAWDDDHDADDAEVFLGLGTRFNLGVQFNF